MCRSRGRLRPVILCRPLRSDPFDLLSFYLTLMSLKAVMEQIGLSRVMSPLGLRDSSIPPHLPCLHTYARAYVARSLEVKVRSGRRLQLAIAPF